jgi:hypothetical protein
MSQRKYEAKCATNVVWCSKTYFKAALLYKEEQGLVE